MGSAVAGLAVFGVLTACGAQPEDVGFGGQPSVQPQPPSAAVLSPPGSRPVPAQPGAGVNPGWPGPPADGVEVPAGQVDAATLPEGYPRLVWTEDDGGVVGAIGQEGGCTQVHAELREQTPQLIRFAFVEVTTSPGPCTMDLRFRPLTVQLDAPLGERTVVLTRS